MRTKQTMPIVVLAFICLMTTLGCTPTEPTGVTATQTAAESNSLQVGCTSNIVKDLVRQIGGEYVEVTAIMDGPGVDPHLYTPSPQDINVLTNSDVVVYSGLHLEAQFEGALESLVNRGIPVIKVTEVLENEFSDRLLQADGAVDPHVWFDLELWGRCGGWLAGELAQIDKVHAEEYRAAATEFQRVMDATRENGRATFAGIPEERRVLVTAHDAFQYFARTFNFQVEAVQGLSTESEPGLKRINELATLLVDSRISAIFTEQSVSDRNILALISACDSRGHHLEVGGTLYSDTAGPAGTREETLAGAVMHNIREIAGALDVQQLNQVKP
ncbi:MAG: zinc ABC transporter substrate-binding protein [Fuerstiella sp.]|nr:zinc ABC transporter substrate-binding protein [Fuerstiella sp.]